MLFVSLQQNARLYCLLEVSGKTFNSRTNVNQTQNTGDYMQKNIVYVEDLSNGTEDLMTFFPTKANP